MRSERRRFESASSHIDGSVDPRGQSGADCSPLSEKIFVVPAGFPYRDLGTALAGEAPPVGKGMTIFRPVLRLLTFLVLLGDVSAWAGDWPLYRHDALGTSNAKETLTAADARTLGVKWRASIPYGAIANPTWLATPFTSPEETDICAQSTPIPELSDGLTPAGCRGPSTASPPLQSPQWGHQRW